MIDSVQYARYEADDALDNPTVQQSDATLHSLTIEDSLHLTLDTDDGFIALDVPLPEL